ncbi:hypothetical protein HY605_05025 [Candidatus Peregrinibacteria bacterium]|nr:hypothetical protein [Candidatus Peregrinibacteria bacterium]
MSDKFGESKPDELPQDNTSQAIKSVIESFRRTKVFGLDVLADQLAVECAKYVDENINVPGVSEEKISAARKAINSALSALKGPKLQKFLDGKNIALRDAGFYMSIALKETLLNPMAKGSSGDLGYFQIIPQFALAEVNDKVLGPAGQKLLKDSDIYYTGDDPAKLATAAKNNAMAGILYWHVCRNIYQKNVPVPTSEKDRDQLADFMYNLGPIYARNLLRSIKPKSFYHFARTIAAQMAKQHPGVIKVDLKPKPKDQYGVKCVPYALKEKPLQKGSATTTIGGKSYRTESLLFALEYQSILKELRSIIVI